jgi:hypothetical protein
MVCTANFEGASVEETLSTLPVRSIRTSMFGRERQQGYGLIA